MLILLFCTLFVVTQNQKWFVKMRRKVGTIPKTLETDLEEGNYYEALQLYKSLQSRFPSFQMIVIFRYESAGKFKESDELVFHGIENMNKYNQVAGFSPLLTRRLSLRMIWLLCISIL